MRFLLGQSIGLLATGVYGSVMVGAEHQHTSRQDASTVSVDLASTQGPPEHLASGFIYGIPDTPNQVPSSFYTNMGFRYTRAGGSQLPAPARGWVYGQTEFQVSMRYSLLVRGANQRTTTESFQFGSLKLPDGTPIRR